VGVALRRRSRGAVEARVARFLEAAQVASEDGKPLLAREWTQRALRLAPADPRVLLDHGYYCAQSGDFDAALAAYEAAALRSSDGDPDFLAGELLGRERGQWDEAAARVVAALEKSPELVFELESRPHLARLLARGEVRDAMDRAQRRMTP
jgi:tetratricopeptide (TPR) repeat protein